jgi:hypothetical protein
LSAGERQNLLWKLKDNFYKLKTRFGNYTYCVQQSIASKGISVETLRDYLLHHTRDVRAVLPSIITADFVEAKTFTSIFLILERKECSSFWNYGIYENLIEHFELDREQKDLKYTEEFKTYVKEHRISELVNLAPVLSKFTDDKMEIIIVLDIDSMGMSEQLVVLQDKVATIMKVPPSEILIYKIGKGSVVVTFLIPQAYLEKLVVAPLRAGTVTSLKKEHILSIMFGGHKLCLDRWNIIKEGSIKHGEVILEYDKNIIREVELDGVPYLALEYSAQMDNLSTQREFMKYLENSLNYDHKNMAEIKGLYYLEDRYPTLIAEKCEPLKKAVMRTKMQEVNQVSFVLGIASYFRSIESCGQSVSIKIDPSTLFACDDGNGQLMAKVYPLFQHSSILPSIDLTWLNKVTKYLHFGNDSDKPLPEEHLMKKMLDERWLSDDDRFRPASFKALCNDLQTLLGKYKKGQCKHAVLLDANTKLR